MTDPNLDIARLSSRISALEKANRRWKMGGLFLFISLVAAASLTGYKAYAQHSMARPVANAVAAKEFVLIGPNGAPGGALRSSKESRPCSSTTTPDSCGGTPRPRWASCP